MPTLVLHGTADRDAPVAHGIELAERIPGAAFYGFDGNGHLPTFTATTEFCDVLGAFVRSGTVPETGVSIAALRAA